MNPGMFVAATICKGRGNRLRERPGKAVLTRFVNDHIHAMSMAIGRIGSLTRFEIQAEASVSRLCMFDHAVDGDVKRRIGIVISCDALKPQCREAGVRAFHCGLNIDMREHTMRQDFFDSKRDQHIPESFFNGRNRFRCTRNRIRPEQHISDSVGKGVEDLPADIVNVVGR